MQTLELVTFCTANTEPARFLNANAEINAWLKRQPGFVSRRLAAKDNGNWIDIVLWVDRDAATRAAAKFLDEMAQSEAVSAIDPQSIAMSHAAIHMSVN
ncbi:MAG: hypothetical protein ACYC0C_10005 [Devosia sp.]